MRPELRIPKGWRLCTPAPFVSPYFYCEDRQLATRSDIGETTTLQKVDEAYNRYSQGGLMGHQELVVFVFPDERVPMVYLVNHDERAVEDLTLGTFRSKFSNTP